MVQLIPTVISSWEHDVFKMMARCYNYLQIIPQLFCHFYYHFNYYFNYLIIFFIIIIIILIYLIIILIIFMCFTVLSLFHTDHHV